jgi:hypothetical protein
LDPIVRERENAARQELHLDPIIWEHDNAACQELHLDPIVRERENAPRQEQKVMNKQTSWKAKAPYERIFVDASGPHPEMMGGNKYWFQAVNDFLRLGWCTLVKKKNEMLNKFSKKPSHPDML